MHEQEILCKRDRDYACAQACVCAFVRFCVSAFVCLCVGACVFVYQSRFRSHPCCCNAQYFLDYGLAAAEVKGRVVNQFASGDFFGEVSFVATATTLLQVTHTHTTAHKHRDRHRHSIDTDTSKRTHKHTHT